jgi:hypothetical protein
MSNGYLLAANADLPDLGDVAAGFGLDTVGAATLGSHEATATELQSAANVGIVLSHAATRDASFVALLHVLARSLRTAQLILVEADARDAFGFLPETWQAMALADARARATDLSRRRAEAETNATPRAHPLPPAPEAPPPVDEATPPPPTLDDVEEDSSTVETIEPTPNLADDGEVGRAYDDGARADSFGVDEAPATSETPTQEQGPASQPIAPEAAAPPATLAPAPAPQPVEPPRQRTSEAAATAPADATAFAPKKLRRDSPELVRIVIHQPKDLQDVIKAARKIDPRTDAAPSGMKVGDVPFGSSVGVSLEVRGAACATRCWIHRPLIRTDRGSISEQRDQDCECPKYATQTRQSTR